VGRLCPRGLWLTVLLDLPNDLPTLLDGNTHGLAEPREAAAQPDWLRFSAITYRPEKLIVLYD